MSIIAFFYTLFKSAVVVVAGYASSVHGCGFVELLYKKNMVYYKVVKIKFLLCLYDLVITQWRLQFLAH